MRNVFLAVLFIGILTLPLSGLAEECDCDEKRHKIMLAQNQGVGSAETDIQKFTITEEELFAFMTFILGVGLIGGVMLASISFVVAAAARRKGLSGFWFFVLSFIFTPIIGFLAVISFPPKPIVDAKFLAEAEEVEVKYEPVEEDEKFNLGTFQKLENS